MAKKKNKKPTGRLGGLKPKPGINGPISTWYPVNFPDGKEEIEELVMDKFIRAETRPGLGFLSVSQNTQNHFDFTLETLSGPIYMDLMEVMYQVGPGNPYQNGGKPIHCGYYALQIMNKIMGKSSKYGASKNVPHHLLIYNTHWDFSLPPELIKLLQHKLLISEHNFEKIFYLSMTDNINPQVFQIYPTPFKDIENFNPALVENGEYVNADMENSRLNPDGTTTVTIVVPLPLKL